MFHLKQKRNSNGCELYLQPTQLNVENVSICANLFERLRRGLGPEREFPENFGQNFRHLGCFVI